MQDLFKLRKASQLSYSFPASSAASLTEKSWRRREGRGGAQYSPAFKKEGDFEAGDPTGHIAESMWGFFEVQDMQGGEKHPAHDLKGSRKHSGWEPFAISVFLVIYLRRNIKTSASLLFPV